MILYFSTEVFPNDPNVAGFTIFVRKHYVCAAHSEMFCGLELKEILFLPSKVYEIFMSQKYDVSEVCV